MKTVSLLAAGLILAASFSAGAVDLGIGTGVAGSASNSTGGAQSTGGSFATLAGFTAQGSAAHGDSSGAATAGFFGNNTVAGSTHTYNSAQTGGAVALGIAGSGNANVAQGTGGSAGAAVGQFVWIFVGP